MHIANKQIAPSPGHQVLVWAQEGLNLLQLWQTRHRRREKLRLLLRHLNERQLRDVGIDIYVARHERSKPFWRA